MLKQYFQLQKIKIIFICTVQTTDFLHTFLHLHSWECVNTSTTIFLSDLIFVSLEKINEEIIVFQNKVPNFFYMPRNNSPLNYDNVIQKS